MHYCFKMREFYFMRHGQTELNKMNRYTGNLDYALNKEGIKQCLEAKKIVETLNIKTVYSSTLLRAKQSVSLVTDIKPVYLKGLEERDFGNMTGKIKPRYFKNFFQNGESNYLFRTRAKRALLKMVLNDSLVVSHSRVYKAICELLGLGKTKIQNGEIVKFCEISKNNWQITKEI